MFVHECVICDFSASPQQHVKKGNKHTKAKPAE